MEMTMENGQVKISGEVISSIVTIAVDTTEGFMLANENFVNKVLLKHDKAVKVFMNENDKVSVTVNVCVKYGLNINKESEKLQQNILENLEIMTSLDIAEINVNVVSLIKETLEVK